jgi:hypothetical protein
MIKKIYSENEKGEKGVKNTSIYAHRVKSPSREERDPEKKNRDRNRNTDK